MAHPSCHTQLGVNHVLMALGELIDICGCDDGHGVIRFADVPLALADRATGKVAGLGAGRPSRAKTVPQA